MMPASQAASPTLPNLHLVHAQSHGEQAVSLTLLNLHLVHAQSHMKAANDCIIALRIFASQDQSNKGSVSS